VDKTNEEYLTSVAFDAQFFPNILWLLRLQRVSNLLVLGKTVGLLLGKNESSVYGHFKATAGGGLQL